MAQRFVELNAGDVWWAAPSPSIGREQAGRRPVVVISGEDYHLTVTTLALVVPVTSTKRGWANHLPVSVSDVSGWAMTEQVRAISRQRLERFVGALPPGQLEEIRGWVLDYLR